jgi:hypothetical protein
MRIWRGAGFRPAANLSRREAFWARPLSFFSAHAAMSTSSSYPLVTRKDRDRACDEGYIECDDEEHQSRDSKRVDDLLKP